MENQCTGLLCGIMGFRLNLSLKLGKVPQVCSKHKCYYKMLLPHQTNSYWFDHLILAYVIRTSDSNVAAVVYQRPHPWMAP